MTNYDKLRSDLALDVAYQPDRPAPLVQNCFHFSSNGNAADELFHDEEDFKDGMNRVAILSLRYSIIILAFVLMDNHVHFVLYGEFDECRSFVHEFMRLTGMALAYRHSERAKTHSIPVDYKTIRDVDYLRTVICYDYKNPTVAGVRYTFYDYPWSSAPILFRSATGWARAMWTTVAAGPDCPQAIKDFFQIKRISEINGQIEFRQTLKSHSRLPGDWFLIDGVIFPGCYIPIDIVASIFRTVRSFNFFCCKNSEKEIDKDAGYLSRLSLPDAEAKEHRDKIIMEKFGQRTIRSLNAQERLEVAGTLMRRYRISAKQAARTVRMPLEHVQQIR